MMLICWNLREKRPLAILLLSSFDSLGDSYSLSAQLSFFRTSQKSRKHAHRDDLCLSVLSKLESSTELCIIFFLFKTNISSSLPLALKLSRNCLTEERAGTEPLPL